MAEEGKHGVQSMEIGMRILQAMVNGHRSMMLKDIAAAADMPASKVHRYLVSLIRGGLVEQDAATSRYDLGPFALNIGLAAIDRLDWFRLGIAAIADLRDAINETTALAVWSDKGPIIVRAERSRRPITVNVVIGTALEMISSASGRIFGAYLPRQTVDALVEQELRNPDLPEAWNTRAKVDALFAEAGRCGLASVSGYHLVPGVTAVAAPVFNFRKEIVLAMLVVGVEGMLDPRPDGKVAGALRSACRALSARLGHEGIPSGEPPLS